jgi:hypothetical protein
MRLLIGAAAVAVGRLPVLIVFALLAGCGGKDAAAPVRTLTSLTVVGGNGQAGTAGVVLPANAVVEARDQDGVPMGGVSVRFSVGGGGALSDTVVGTGANGRASTSWILGANASVTQSLRATAGMVSTDLSATSSPPVVGQTHFGREGYIEYIAGDLPIVITAPHGGTLAPAELPNRTGSGITTVRDVSTEELARTIGNVFASQGGGRPHIIIVRLHRTKIDANREVVEATQGDRLAGRAWVEFHSFVEAAKQAVIATHGTGFYIDLHGHGHAAQRLELGYLLSSSALGLSDAALDAGDYESRSGIRMLSVASPASFSALLRGPTSLGALFETAGFPSVPSASTPDPAGADYFTGGYNTEVHGSRQGGPISGVQIETNFTGVRDSQVNRERFAAALVSVMSQYLAAHRGAVTVP